MSQIRPQDLGVPASPSGLRPFGVEPAAQSQAEPLVPNAAQDALVIAFGGAIHRHGVAEVAKRTGQPPDTVKRYAAGELRPCRCKCEDLLRRLELSR